MQTETDQESRHNVQRLIAGDVPIYLVAGALLAISIGLFWAYDVGRLKPGTAYAKSLPDQHAVDGARIPTLAEVFALVMDSVPGAYVIA